MIYVHCIQPYILEAKKKGLRMANFTSYIKFIPHIYKCSISYKYLPIKPLHRMIARRQILIGHLNLEMVCIFIFNKQGFDVIHAGIRRYNGHHDEPSSLCSIL